MKYFRFLFLVFSICSMANALEAQSKVLDDEVVSAIKKGDSKTLSALFNDNIEVILPSKSGVYSRQQAEMVFKDFFTKHKVVAFEVIHEGKKENASFAIANYKTAGGHYRFTFLTKPAKGKMYIHQIRIEKQDNE